MDKKEIATVEAKELVTQNEAPLGFDDEEPADMIIPRVKVIQTLSPERKDKQAEEGDIINSLTKEKLNGKVFIPVFKYTNNIWWKDRADGGGMNCYARDGRTGEMQDGTKLTCAICRKNEFDNSKQGKEAVPKCTKYINFFGFFEGERMPIIMSFAKTNYNEGRKLYSLAKVTMQNMWNHGYVLKEKLLAKNGNEWYIVNADPAGTTTEEDRAFALELYKNFKDNIQNMTVNMDDDADLSGPSATTVSDAEF